MANQPIASLGTNASLGSVAALPQNRTSKPRQNRIAPPPVPPTGVTQAAQSWAKLHGHKFAKNAGRFGRK